MQSRTDTGLFVAIRKYFTGWQGSVNFFDFLGHLANLIGVGSHAIISWLPLLKNVIEMLGVADPLIYCFRAAEKIVRYIGRNYFSVTFEEEKYNKHAWQNEADIGIVLLFVAAIVLFFAASFPFHLSLAWFLGLTGVSINGYFDHRHPEISAKTTYYAKKEHDNEVFTDYLKKYYSTRLYYALIFSLVMLLMLGSATGLGLPFALNLGFAFLAKLGSLSVIVCNIARPINNYSPEILYKIHKKIHQIFFCCLEPPKKKTDLVQSEIIPPIGSNRRSSFPIIELTTKMLKRSLSLPSSKEISKAKSSLDNKEYKQNSSYPCILPAKTSSKQPRQSSDTLSLPGRQRSNSI